MSENDRPWWARCQCKKPSPSVADYHDSTYCSQCYAWLSKKCSDVECTYCKGRPPYNIYAAQSDNSLDLESLLEEDLAKFFGSRT